MLLYSDIQPGIERERALSDFSEMLLDADRNGLKQSEVFPDGFDAFYHDLVSSLPFYSTECKQRKRMRKRMGIAAVAAVLLITVVAIYLSVSGYFGLWARGIAYLAEDLSRYTYSASVDPKEYTVEIDLSDLKSNAGKIIYKKEECYIEIYQIDNYGVFAGGYRVFFRSHGRFAHHEGLLVSGVKHNATEERYFTYKTEAALECTYHGKTYICPVQGNSGLNYRDGDMFGFYLFPGDAYGSDGIPEQNAGTATIKISRLIENIWTERN